MVSPDVFCVNFIFVFTKNIMPLLKLGLTPRLDEV